MRTEPDRNRVSREARPAAPVAPPDWPQTHAALRAADSRGELGAAALELLAEASRWTGHDGGIVEPLERAHAAYAAQQDTLAAARTALALVHVHSDHCRHSVAASWLTRAAALLDGLPERREHGWLAWFRARAAGAAGEATAQRAHSHAALTMAQRHGDRGLEALATMELAHVAGAHDAPAEALRWVEQATAIVLAGEADIFPAGEVFCGTIWLFRSRGEWDRAQQWVDASDRWVARQRVQYFPGMCRMHRSEVLRIRGRLADAEEESLRATEMLAHSLPVLSSIAFAELGEVRRRRNDVPAARAAFDQAIKLGWDPQPGMALLLLADGRAAEAMRTLERTFRGGRPTYLLEDRANLLAARTTVALANRDIATAQQAVDALGELARKGGTAWERAWSAEARGRLELAGGHAEAAVDQLRQARRIWTELETPFELATTCTVLADALARAGDTRQGRLAMEAADEILGRLGVRRDPRGDAEQMPASATAAIDPDSAATDDAPALFAREGDYWTIRFAGRTLRIKDSRGVQHLAELLSRPGESIWALELAGGVTDSSDAGPLLDGTAKRAYEQRLRELEEELADARSCADEGRIDAARREMDALARQVAAAVGLGGRDRRAPSAPERARQTVTKAIRSVIRRLGADHGELGEHLTRCVRTGASCEFVPDRRELVEWRVERPRSRGASS